jgi:hypothetical protein
MFTIRSRRLTLLTGGLLIAISVSLGVGMIGQADASGVQLPLLQVTNTPVGQLVLPTATATPPGGATATASRTPTFPVVLIEAVGEANLRDGPGLDFDLVGTLTAGNPVPVIGRSPNFPWYVVEWEDAPEGVAWVYEELVVINGDITTIPIYADPAAPTLDPTQAAVQATATVLLQTPGAAETATATALFAPTGIFTSTPPDAVGAQPGGTPPPPQFTPAPPVGQTNGQPPVQPPPAGTGIPPAMVIITLGGLGILALVVSILRR